MQKFALAIALISSVAVCASKPAYSASTEDPRPSLLASLDGDWVMVGDVRGKPVTYKLVVTPVLGNTFTELHMKDVQVPAHYEARVFIGYDKESNQIIAHWLDNFGAKYSIPHGTGNITENTIQFQIPYSHGPFRDTLTFDPIKKTWLFEIEASESSGNWKHFAKYEIKK
ncbi:MAG: DUF1579 family protein [Burkholderiales bacterium]|nr:DUF1579 family protein [Burkholderiales bacterium]